VQQRRTPLHRRIISAISMSLNAVKHGSSFNRNEATCEDCKQKKLADPADCLNRVPLARSRSILHRTFCFSLVAALLLITAHRLPAPIQEVPESPTPAPEQGATKPKHPSKSKRRTEESEAPRTNEKSNIAEGSKSQLKKKPQERFAGAWSGTISQGLWGNVEFTLVLNAAGTSVTDKSGFGTFTHAATSDGNMTTWQSGLLSEIRWTLTPNPDGKTALVTSRSALGVNGSATFTRTKLR